MMANSRQQTYDGATTIQQQVENFFSEEIMDIKMQEKSGKLGGDAVQDAAQLRQMQKYLRERLYNILKRDE